MWAQGRRFTVVATGLLAIACTGACRRHEPARVSAIPMAGFARPGWSPPPAPRSPVPGFGGVGLSAQPPEPTPTATPTPTPIVGERLDGRLADTILCDVQGLLERGAAPATYDEFRATPGAACGVFEGGKISDPPAALPCFTCTVRLAGATGRYEFFPDAAGEVATLQQVHITSPWLDAGGVPSESNAAAASLGMAVDALIAAQARGASGTDAGGFDSPTMTKDPDLSSVLDYVEAFPPQALKAWPSVRVWRPGADLVVRYWEVLPDGGPQARLGVAWRRGPLTEVERAWDAEVGLDRYGPDFGSKDWRLGEQVFYRERLYPVDAYEACREARLTKCGEGRLGIERLDQQQLGGPLDEAVAALSRAADPIKTPALAFWADQLATAWGLACRLGTGPANRDALAAVGFEYQYSRCREEWELHRDLLQRLALERQDARWGQLAFRVMSRRGWEVGSVCEGGPGHSPADDVIARGEAFLRAHPDSYLRSEIAFDIATAYEGRWVVWGREENAAVAPDLYKPGAEEARRMAIVYYRLVLDGDLDLGEVERTWLRQKLFRLERRLNTWQEFYYCDCD